MAQAPPQTRPRRLSARAILSRVLLIGVLAAASSVLAQAQAPAPYLLMQGPTQGKSRAFLLGEQIMVRFRGEDEFFPLRIKELYPDTKAVLLGENLIKLSDIAAVRIPNRHGLKDYLRIQGVVNFVVIGLAALADREVRQNQQGFILGASVVSGAMVAYGSLDRFRTREVGTGRRFILVIGGGVEAEEVAPERPRRY